jgi:hypothetical protein
MNVQLTFFVKGIRVTLYNAITVEQTEKLVAYIREFVEQEAARLQVEERIQH